MDSGAPSNVPQPLPGRQPHAGTVDTSKLLTPQQLRCLQAAARGMTSKQIAKEIGLSPKTIEGHLQSCRERLGVHSTLDAMTGLLMLSDANMQTAASPLTPRQAECLRALVLGGTPESVAADFGISLSCVNFHLEGARRRLGVFTTAAAIAVAVRNGWLKDAKRANSANDSSAEPSARMAPEGATPRPEDAEGARRNSVESSCIFVPQSLPASWREP